METPASLLERLRRPAAEAEWARFVQLYTPLLYHWARQVGARPDEAADLVQEVFALLVQKLPDFAYDRSKSFRSWLRTVTLNKWREVRRRPTAPRQAQEADLEDLASPDSAAEIWEAEYRDRVVSRALELMRTDFQTPTWQAFWEHRVAGRSAPEVAAELGLSVNAVYLATSRVLRRLREELDGLLN